VADPKKHLVRCAGCGHNFETERYGRLTCPICRSQIWLEPPPGHQPPTDADAEAGGETDRAPSAAQPGATDGTAPEAESGDDDAAQPEAAGRRRAAADSAPQRQAEPAADSAESSEAGDDEASPGKKADSGEPTPPEMEALRRLLAAGQRLARHPEEQPPPWEAGPGGALRRFGATVRQVFTQPSLFFARLPSGGLGRPFLFGWLIGTLGIACFALNGLWQLDANRQQTLEALRAAADAESAAMGAEQLLESMHSFLLFSLLAAPLLGAINLWVTAGLNHLGVRLAAGEHRGFRMTFRATAYAITPMLLLALPWIGNPLGGMWTVVVEVIAIGQVHRLRSGRATLAVLLPVFSVLMLMLWLSSG
jgi:DNA-directed RNA polymerase subunit RPC12/RpoP